MKLVLAETGYFKDSISVISELVNEARFKVTKDAIELIAMDPANVAMVVFKLLSSCFSEYQVEGEESLAINLANLKQVLKRVKGTDVLTLESADNKLNVKLQGGSTRKFSLPIIDLEEKEQKVPELEFPVSIKTNSGTLSDAIDDVDVVAESVSFETNQGKFSVNAEGDLSKVSIDIESGNGTEIQAPQDEIKAKYSIEYLKKIIQGSKITNDVSVQFNKDYPLKIEFKAMDKCLLSFILAPRVENN